MFAGSVLQSQNACMSEDSLSIIVGVPGWQGLPSVVHTLRCLVLNKVYLPTVADGSI